MEVLVPQDPRRLRFFGWGSRASATPRTRMVVVRALVTHMRAKKFIILSLCFGVDLGTPGSGHVIPEQAWQLCMALHAGEK